MDKKIGKIITFYSYKGGVGRSMALANIGVLLAQRANKVLLVDWDLEAPGLEMYFSKQISQYRNEYSNPNFSNGGMLNLIDSHGSIKKLDWENHIIKTEIDNLDILPSGHASDDYHKRIKNLNWVDFFNIREGANFINSLREEWVNNYDFVLVDSRTGITDIGDICTALLPDILVVMFVSNHQNINGIIKIVDRARRVHKKLPYDRSRLQIVPVPARDESNTEYELSKKWKDRFSEKLGYLYEWLPIDVSVDDVINKIFIPYVTNWSFGERLPVVESPKEFKNPSSISAAYSRLASLLESQLDWNEIDRTTEPYEIQQERGLRLELEKESSRKDSTLRQAILRNNFLIVTAMTFGFMTFATSYLYYKEKRNLETESKLQVEKIQEELEKVINNIDFSELEQITVPEKIVLEKYPKVIAITVSTWGGGSHTEYCVPQLSKKAGYVLIGGELGPSIQHSERNRVGCPPPGHCDSAGEFCSTIERSAACYVNKEWYDWKVQELSKTAGNINYQTICNEKEPVAALIPSLDVEIEPSSGVVKPGETIILYWEGRNVETVTLNGARVNLTDKDNFEIFETTTFRFIAASGVGHTVTKDVTITVQK